MSIVFAAITPHSPLLLPIIGKEHRSQAQATLNAYKHLEEDCYAANVESLLVISPHGPMRSNAFLLNLAPEYRVNLEKFGDYSTKTVYQSDIGLAHRLREQLETSAPLQLITDPNLDYGSAIPLELLSGTTKPMILPLYYSQAPLSAHFEFGQQLQHELISSHRRIGVIASGDLSHRLSPTAPAGFSPKAEKFDRKLVELLQKNSTSEILNLNESVIAEAMECGLKSIAILLGILEGVNAEPQRLCYEAPFGVGYLTLKYRL